jgi:hypothetical protein
VSVPSLVPEDVDQSLHQVRLLEQVGSAETLVAHGVDEGHGVLQHLAVIKLQESLNQLDLLVGVLAVEEVEVHVGVDHLS